MDKPGSEDIYEEVSEAVKDLESEYRSLHTSTTDCKFSNIWKINTTNCVWMVIIYDSTV